MHVGHHGEEGIGTMSNDIKRIGPKDLGVQLLAAVCCAVDRRALPNSTTRPSLEVLGKRRRAPMFLETTIKLDGEADLESPRVVLWFKLDQVEEPDVVEYRGS